MMALSSLCAPLMFAVSSPRTLNSCATVKKSRCNWWAFDYFCKKKSRKKWWGQSTPQFCPILSCSCRSSRCWWPMEAQRLCPTPNNHFPRFKQNTIPDVYINILIEAWMFYSRISSWLSISGPVPRASGKSCGLRRTIQGDQQWLSDSERVLTLKIMDWNCVRMKAKRERKSKFNVREVLNLKESSPKVARAFLDSWLVDII